MFENVLRAAKNLTDLGVPTSVAEAFRGIRAGGPMDTMEVRIDCGCGFQGFVSLRTIHEQQSHCQCGLPLRKDVLLPVLQLLKAGHSEQARFAPECIDPPELPQS